MNAPFEPGDRVRLRPKQRADLVDIALTGRAAVVDRVEEGFDGRTYVVVMIEGDPGRDLGAMSQLGHRFFFGPEELELTESASEAPRVLVASIGDAYATDGRFGEEVTRRLRELLLPPGVHIADFGIRVADLIDVLDEGYERVVLIGTEYDGSGQRGSLRIAEPSEKAEGWVVAPLLRQAISRIGTSGSRPWLVMCRTELGGRPHDGQLSPRASGVVEEAVRRTGSILEDSGRTNSTVEGEAPCESRSEVDGAAGPRWPYCSSVSSPR